MQGTDFIGVFIASIERASIDYFVTGSVASILYGEPRLTHDIDLVMNLTLPKSRLLADLFPLDSYYCPPDDVIHEAIKRDGKGQFNLIHHETGLKADIFIAGSDPLHHWAMTRRLRVNIDDASLWVAPPEYVIVRKLQYFGEGGSQKHLTDIRGVLSQRQVSLDLEWISEQLTGPGLMMEWERLIKEAKSLFNPGNP